MDLQSLPWYGQFLVFLLIGGVFFGIFYMLVYSENESVINSLNTKIENLDRDIKKAEQKEMQLKKIKQEKEARERVLDKLKEILPEQKEISQILRKVQSIISGARLKIQRWTTQPERRQEIYVEVPILITLDGNYHNIGIFFDQLAKLKKIFTVSNLTIKPMRRMTSTFAVTAIFTASTYTYKERTAATTRGKKKKRRRR